MRTATLSKQHPPPPPFANKVTKFGLEVCVKKSSNFCSEMKNFFFFFCSLYERMKVFSLFLLCTSSVKEWEGVGNFLFLSVHHQGLSIRLGRPPQRNQGSSIQPLVASSIVLGEEGGE